MSRLRLDSAAKRGECLPDTTRVRTRVKAAEAGGENADEAVRAAMKTIDKAAAKGVIHKNEASRRKSRLQKRVSASS